MTRKTFAIALATTLTLGLAARVGYVLAQPSHDPAWNVPILDGRYYVDWARALSGEGTVPSGAFYLAPLYPYALALFFRGWGESLTGLFLLQEAALVATAGALALLAWRRAGEGAAVATAVLVLLYQPAMFFAARPVGETLALTILAASLLLIDRSGPWPAAAAGVLGALGALARPNLLLVPLLWIAIEAVSRRWRRAGLLAGALAVILGGVAARNAVVSGHPVPVSSNGGITFYHGNGPGATGGFTQPRGLSGRLDTQREEATALARLLSGRDLDAVEADAWWARRALEARIDDPVGTIRLLAWRTVLLVDSYEHGLDYAPALDANPWRLTAPVPFGALLGLAVAGVILVGFGRTGGASVWSAVAASAAAPVLFYAASRYRLPASVVLCVPAGVGLAALFEAGAPSPHRRRAVVAPLVFLAVTAAAWMVPSAPLARASEASALANLADTLQKAGRLVEAERVAREGIRRDPEGAASRFQLAVLLEKQGRLEEAEQVYHDAVGIDPGHAAAAANLSRLWVADGRHEAAVAVLEEALRSNPNDALCWNNLVVALSLAGERDKAIGAWHEAKRRGVSLEPGLLEAVEETGSAGDATER